MIQKRKTTPLNDTDVSWTDYTWGCLHGCSKVSPGCKNCYAERVSLRYGHTDEDWTAEHAEQNVQIKDHKFDEPVKHLQYDPCSEVFAPSMSDLFHELIPDDTVRTILGVMRNTPTIIYQVLTKRPERAAEWPDFPPNVWLGTSVENADYVDRIDHLREANADTRFVSFEPLIAPVGQVNLDGIDWVIVGGESEPDPEQRREMDHEWAVEILEQANTADIPMWFKQSSGAKSETGTKLAADGDYMRTIREKPPVPEAVREARENFALDQLDETVGDRQNADLSSFQ